MVVHRNKSLRHLNTLALQSHAHAFVSVANDIALQEALQWARTHKLQALPLGEGSNVVFTGDIDALVVQVQSKGIEVLEQGRFDVKLRVAAGESWHHLVQWTLQRGFYGLENLALIPGTVGAAPVQNIGAYGVELESVLLQVHAVQIADNKSIVLARDACEFAYRDSVFKRQLADQVVITAVDLVLSLQPTIDLSYPALQHYFAAHSHLSQTPETVFQAVVSIRRTMLPDPAVEPNAGSFFKNPVVQQSQVYGLLERFSELPQYPMTGGEVKLSAAWMIDYCGWKGFRRRGFGVHPQHALVLVNYSNDSGEQLLAFADEIAESVYTTFGVQLQIEPRVYGQFNDRV
ncbi:MAG: UDP-N-acetylmuramate dehydrogenase [Halioglobus sp.]